MADIVKTLNDLIARCRDSEAGFGEAEEVCRSVALRDRLTGIARQRAEFAGELAGYIRKLNGVAAPARRGGAQGWFQADAPDDASFLAACIAGEENTLRAYEIALTKDLPVAVRPVVDRQRLAVQETLLELRSVRMVRTA